METTQPLIQEDRSVPRRSTPLLLEDYTVQVEETNDMNANDDTQVPSNEAPLSTWALLRLLWRVELAAALLGVMAGTLAPVLPDVQKEAFGEHAYTATGSLGAVLGIASFVVIPFIGGLGDRIGRSYALCIALCLYSITFLPMIVHPYVKVFLVVHAFLGFQQPLISVLFSYVADVIRQRKVNRASAMVVPMFFFFLGLIVASIGSQAIYSRLGMANVYRVGLGVTIITILYTFFFLPNLKTEAQRLREIKNKTAESHTEADEMHDAFEVDTAPRESLWQRLKHLIAATRAALARHPSLRYLLLASFFNNIAEQTLHALIGLYFKNVAGFTPKDQSVILVALGLSSMASFVIVVPLVTRYIGPVFLIRVAMFTNVFVMLGMAFARELWQACLILLFVAVTFSVFPCSATFVAWECDTNGTADNVGLLVGLMTAARLLAEGIAPPLLGMMLDKVQDTSVPGSPFFVCAVTAFVGGLFSLGIPRDCDHDTCALHATTTTSPGDASAADLGDDVHSVDA